MDDRTDELAAEYEDRCNREMAESIAANPYSWDEHHPECQCAVCVMDYDAWLWNFHPSEY